MTPCEELVVRVDHRRVNRRFGAIEALQALVLLGVLWASGYVAGLDGSGSGLAPFVFIIVGVVFQMTFTAWIWGVQIGAAEALVVSPTGISVPVPPHGRVNLGWDAIGSIEARRLHIVISPVTDLGPESPEVSASSNRRLWRRLHRRGALVPIKLVDTGVSDIAVAVRALSTGSVEVKTAA